MNLLKKLSVNFLATGGVSLLIAIILNTYVEKTDWYDMPKFFRDFLNTTIGQSYSGNFLYDVILLVLIIVGVVFILDNIPPNKNKFVPLYLKFTYFSFILIAI